MEKRITGRTGMFCLIGTPVGHSGSPAMYNYSFAQTGLDYAPFMLMAAGIVLVFGGCVAFARKKQLFV